MRDSRAISFPLSFHLLLFFYNQRYLLFTLCQSEKAQKNEQMSQDASLSAHCKVHTRITFNVIKRKSNDDENSFVVWIIPIYFLSEVIDTLKKKH